MMVSAVAVGIVAILAWRGLSLSSLKLPVHVPSESAILITGGARGIGKATAHYLSNQGYTILVTVRKQADYDALLPTPTDANEDDNGATISSTNKSIIYPVLLDVTNDAHVEPAVARAKSVLAQTNTKLIAIVNNAGINPEGEALAKYFKAGDRHPNVLTDLATVSRVLETNVVGVFRVTRAFLPLLTGNHGRIVNLGSYFGSVAGVAGLSHAAYETSKFALEGLSDNLRRSLRKENIHVSIIKAGNIQTDMNEMFGEVSAEVVAKDVHHAIASSSPRARYYPGKVQGMSCRLVCLVFDMLPSSVNDRL